MTCLNVSFHVSTFFGDLLVNLFVLALNVFKILPTAIRELHVSRRNGGLFQSPLKALGPPQHYSIDGFLGGP